jgi:hypothetical protein
MRKIKLIPKEEYQDQGNLFVIDEIIQGVNGGLFLVTEAGGLLPLFSIMERFKFPKPDPEGTRGATLEWSLRGWARSDAPPLELYDQLDHEIDLLV